MSVEQAKAFVERMKTDEAFRAKVMAIEDGEGRIACINSEGYECTVQEIKDISAGQELGDVSGVGGLKLFTSQPCGERCASDTVETGAPATIGGACYFIIKMSRKGHEPTTSPMNGHQIHQIDYWIPERS